MSNSTPLPQTSSNDSQQKGTSQTSRDHSAEPRHTLQSNSPSSTGQAISSEKEHMSPSSKAQGSAVDSSKQSEANSVERAMDKAKSKISRKPSNAEPLANDEEDFDRQKAKAIEKQRKKDEYERLGLRDKTVYGMGGHSGFN